MKIGMVIGMGVAVLAATVWLSVRQGDGGRADPHDTRQVARGEALYREHCAACHGQRLEGQPDWRYRNVGGRLPAPPHDETGHTWHHSDAQIFRLTKDGLVPPLAPPGYESDMPAFGAVLMDEQIWAVLAFLKSRWPSPIRDRQSRLNAGEAR